MSRLGVAVIVLTIGVDQISKAISEATLPFGATFDLVPLLALHRVHNPGIALSFLTGFGAWPLVALTATITILVLGIWSRATEGGRWATVGYALIVGGAVGNLIDRILHGYVIDFLLLHIGEHTLFVFNLADVALTIGPLLLIIVYLWPLRSRS
ncbi:MAG: signal peptidase II [Hyphomicrobiales bacterium]|nr:signal peptidase II [Hyphomicrobiales bacterium]